MNTTPSLEDVADNTKHVETAAAIGVSPELHEEGLKAARKAWHAAQSNEATREESRDAAKRAYDETLEAARLTREQVAGGGFTSPEANAPAAPDSAPGITPKADASGFSPPAKLFLFGAREDAPHGVRAMRREWDRKPMVGDACLALESRIRDEQRRDRIVPMDGIGMRDVDGVITMQGRMDYVLSRSAFYSLVSRLGYSGGAYLEKCPIPLRAANVNAWRLLIEQAETERRFAAGEKYKRAELTLRQRTRPELGGARETFAVVSPSYAAFDADKIARSIRRAAPADARGDVAYDGMRTRFGVTFASTVQPENYAVGETFQVGVVITAGDGGAHSITVRTVVWQSLCLNLMVIDKQSIPVAQIRHVGSEQVLARRFEAAFERAQKAIEPFLQAWGYACSNDVVEAARGSSDVTPPADQREAIRGIFAGLLDRKQITPPEDLAESTVIDDLVAAWERDDSSATRTTRTSRAAVVNAITRAAHEWSSATPWIEDLLQQQAGALLWGKGARPPAALVYVEPEPLIVPAATASN